MNNLSNLSSILTLSSQLKAISSLEKYPNIMASVTGSIPEYSNIGEVSAFIKKVNNTFNQIYGNKNLSALTDPMTSVVKVNLDALSSGIKVYDNNVEISHSAKVTLDSLKSELRDFTPKSTEPNKHTKSDKKSTVAIAKVIPVESSNDEITIKSYSFSKEEFNKKYLPSIQYFMEQIVYPMIVVILTTNPYALSPLIDVVSQFHDNYVKIEQQKLEEEKIHNELLQKQNELLIENNKLLQSILNQHQSESECLEEEHYYPPNTESSLSESHNIETPLPEFPESSPETAALPNANNSN